MSQEPKEFVSFDVEGAPELHDARSDDFEKLREEFRAVRLHTVMPLTAWLKDRPWDLLWVRWFAFFALFPLLLARTLGVEEIQLGQAAWALGIYFALLWLVVLSLFMRPQKIGMELFAQISLFTIIVGMTLVLILQRLPILNTLYAETQSQLLLARAFGYVLGVGLLEEAMKALPVYLFALRKNLPFRPLTFAYLGVFSGLAFGVAEAVSYSFLYAFGVRAGVIDLGGYMVVQVLRLITLPLLHALWSGIVGYFIGLAALHRSAPRALMMIGVALAAVLHGAYDTFANGWLGVGVAALSLLIFISYVRTSDLIAKEIVQRTTSDG
jgi:RsiW-degrading membrane proteinase PrsW (M82 family)